MVKTNTGRVKRCFQTDRTNFLIDLKTVEGFSPFLLCLQEPGTIIIFLWAILTYVDWLNVSQCSTGNILKWLITGKKWNKTDEWTDSEAQVLESARELQHNFSVAVPTTGWLVLLHRSYWQCEYKQKKGMEVLGKLLRTVWSKNASSHTICGSICPSEGEEHHNEKFPLLNNFSVSWYRKKHQVSGHHMLPRPRQRQRERERIS